MKRYIHVNLSKRNITITEIILRVINSERLSSQICKKQNILLIPVKVKNRYRFENTACFKWSMFAKIK